MTGDGWRADAVRRVVAARLAQWYGPAADEIADDRPFAELGLTSRDAVALAAEVGDAIGERLPSTLLWEAPTLGALAQWLDREGEDVDEDEDGGVKWDEEPLPRSAAPAPDPAARESPVAVIGIGCRLPGGVTGPASLWRLLSDGRDAVGTVPADRWGGLHVHGRAGRGQHARRLPPRHRGIRRGVLRHLAARGRRMDPQQRLLLEVAWEALEDAGIARGRPRTAARTGVFVGISSSDYDYLAAPPTPSGDRRLHGDRQRRSASPPGRLSYFLDLRGPEPRRGHRLLVVAGRGAPRLSEPARGESDAGAGGGVNLMLSPDVHGRLSRGRGAVADGRCKTFDERADGYRARRGVRRGGAEAARRRRCATATGCCAVIRGTRGQPGRPQRRADRAQRPGAGGT